MALDRALAREQQAPQRDLDFLPLLVDLGADDKEPVGRPQGLVPGRVPAAHGDGRGRLFDDLEVVGNVGALVITAGRELLVGPEVLGSLGAPPLTVQVQALHGVACSQRALIHCTIDFGNSRKHEAAKTNPIRSIGRGRTQVRGHRLR